MISLSIGAVYRLGTTLADSSATPTPGGGVLPNPGMGTMPPGTDGINTIVSWVARVVALMCVIGFLIVAGKMAVSHDRGQAGQHMMGLAMVMGACILLGAASAIVSVLA